MMQNYDQSVEINHNLSWPYIPEHLCRILIIGGSGSGKTERYINNQILAKFIYTSKIHLNQSINCLLMEEKNSELKI